MQNDTKKYLITNSVIQDLEFIYWLFEEAKKFHEENDFPAWKNFDISVLRKDIENKNHYKIVAGDKIVCIFSAIYHDPFIWRERETGDAIYLHRIVVHPNYRGQRSFEKIFQWAIKDAQEKKLRFIRMDTWANNKKIIAYYKGYGFQFLENYTTPDTEELPAQNRNLAHALLEYAL